MNVVVDFGNTAAKVGIFNQHRLVEKLMFDNETDLKKFLENFSAEHFIISSVSKEPKIILSWTNASRKFILTHTLPVPITNQYTTPETLGVDRLAAVCGAQHLYPDSNCLVIDTGTCIKYDFIDRKGIYHGGAISPGLKMRFEAMHSFTARLPMVDITDNPEFIGNSTETCLQSGGIYGAIDEMDGAIQRYQDKFSDLKVILCGGDTRFFENKLKASIFAVPELVLSGLNSILIYNVNR